ncbi:MAG TPA: DUF819 family protein [Spirochaetota bacterium]|nr:DUF819 family protein [Spirochaetota bacterium]
MTIIFVAFFLLFPALAIYLCYRYPAVNKIGTVILCYLAGITIGNLGILPAGFDTAQKNLSEISVVLALPLLLYSMDIRKWSRLAGRTILSFALATAAIIVISLAGYFIIKGTRPDAWKMAGLAIGVYTGGTPNLAAIKAALEVDATTFIIFHTYDTVISLIYIIFCVTVAQRFFLLFLPPFANRKGIAGADSADLEAEDIHSYGGMLDRKYILPLGAAFLLTVLVVAVSVGAGSLVHANFATTVIILLITSLGIALSFVPKIRAIGKTFQLGMYIIYVFCLTVGSMANFSMIINIDWTLLFYVTFCIMASMALHALLCRFFKVDADTFIITSVSAICSPPFVPVVAYGLKNREVIISGITTGIIGYAIGNYLGISLAYLFRGF